MNYGPFRLNEELPKSVGAFGPVARPTPKRCGQSILTSATIVTATRWTARVERVFKLRRHVLSLALTAYGMAFRDADPVGALNALGRGLVIAQDSGNRAAASVLANRLALLEAEHGDTVAAFDHLTLAIRIFHNAGNT